MLAWESLTQSDFDRTVELLIKRWYARNHPEFIVQAIDGRGGDGGIDLDVRDPVTGKLIKIYQLKFFPEGFSGGFKPRREQIRRSFEKAAKLHPPVWTLVIPRNFTVNERKWVSTLATGSGIRVEYVGRVELDDLQASDPDAVALAERTADRKALELVGRESAALLTMDDVAREVKRLATRTDAMSPHWSFETTTRGDTLTRSLFAKHPDAATREPLSINFTANFMNHPELRKEYEDSMEYGISKTVTLPPEVVETFERIGPEWFAARFGASTLEIHPSPTSLRDLPATIRISPQGAQNRVLRGIATWITQGSAGARVETVFDGGLTITWRLTRDRGPGSSITLSFEPTNHTGIDVERAIRALAALHQNADVVLEVDGHKDRLTVEPALEFSVATEVAELAEDLAAIEQLTGTQFAFPRNVNAMERIWIRIVRRLLEGDCVLAPDLESLSFTFNGKLGESIEELLTNPSAIIATTSHWSRDVLGEEVTVGDVSIYHPAIRIVDASEHLEALRAGKGAGRTAVAVPNDPRLGFRLYSPSRLKAEQVLATPWGLTGVTEHTELEATAGEPG